MITGVIRLVYFFRIDLFADVTYHSVETMTWTVVEPGVYLIAATLPSLRPLVRYVFHDVEWDNIYNHLLDRCSRAFSTQKSSDASTANPQFNSGITHTTSITVGSGVRSVGFVKIDDDLRGQGSRVSKDGTELATW